MIKACCPQVLYRHLVDDYLIKYCEKLKKKDFIVKTKRVYLYRYFEMQVEVLGD